jgi:hypothetical protein
MASRKCLGRCYGRVELLLLSRTTELFVLVFLLTSESWALFRKVCFQKPQICPGRHFYERAHDILDTAERVRPRNRGGAFRHDEAQKQALHHQC